MTLNGETPVENIKAGDRIITRDSGMTIVKSVAHKHVKMQAIRIKAGSLGHTRPDRDMIVSPDAQLHIRDWRAEALFGTASASVPASRLVDGEFLAAQDSRTVTLHTITFDRPHIVYADGIEMIIGA